MDSVLSFGADDTTVGFALPGTTLGDEPQDWPAITLRQGSNLAIIEGEWNDLATVVTAMSAGLQDIIRAARDVVYGEDDKCIECRAHIADPHLPDCIKDDGEL
jgi:hypothetical protein